MSVSLPNGATVEIASGTGSALIVSAITNADPAAATSTAHGLTEGDYAIVTSGWSRLTDRVIRVGVVADANTFELEDIDTTSTSVYPAGAGTGSVKEITGWTQLQQILTSTSNGGEQQFLDYQFLESDAAKRIPTFKSPAGLSFTVADDPTLAGYILAKAANDDRLPRAVRVNLPNGAKLLYYAYISLAPSPSLSVNEVMAVQVTLSLLGEPVRYAD